MTRRIPGTGFVRWAAVLLLVLASLSGEGTYEPDSSRRQAGCLSYTRWQTLTKTSASFSAASLVCFCNLSNALILPGDFNDASASLP